MLNVGTRVRITDLDTPIGPAEGVVVDTVTAAEVLDPLFLLFSGMSPSHTITRVLVDEAYFLANFDEDERAEMVRIAVEQGDGEEGARLALVHNPDRVEVLA